jgi:hypothetical protein
MLQAGELLENGRFEGESAGLAKGWVNNCWGKNTVVFSPGEPHDGKTSQKVVCQEYQTGAVQFFAPLKLTAGKHYRVSVWMRAEGGVSNVGVGLRHGPEPYTMHLSRHFELSDQWEQYSFSGVVSASDNRVGLFLWFVPDGSGTLWVDEASVIEEDPPVVHQPVPTGNVVPNGSFELELARDWRAREANPVLDADRPLHGSRSLRWDLDGKPQQLVSRMIQFGTDGREFTLALGARANGDVRLVAEVWPGMAVGAVQPVLRVECRPKASWGEYRVSGLLPANSSGGYYLSLRLAASSKASVWLDAVRLEPAPASAPFRCARPIEASLASSAVAHIVREGNPVELTLRAFNDTDQPQARTLRCRATDYWRKPAGEASVDVDLKPHAVTERLVRIPIAKTGVFLVELVDGDEPLSEISLSVLPKLSPIPAEQSAIGAHFRLDEFHMAVANQMGIKWTRIHDCETITHWATVEPEKGTLVWNDEKVRVAHAHGVQILGEFLRVPEWASSAAGKVTGFDLHQHPPRDLQEFGAYVRAVVNHYKNDIRHWEIWNEPYHTGFWRGTPEEYAAMAQVASREARAADPQAVILAPSAYPGAGEWVERVQAAGGLRATDVFSYHGYDTFAPKGYQRVRDWAALQRKPPLPIWNTETGVSSKTFYRRPPDTLVDNYTHWLRAEPYDRAAEQSTQLAVLALAGGAKRYFQYWSVYEDTLLPRLSAMSIFEYDGSLRPMAVAYAVAASLLDGTSGQGWIELSGRGLANILADDQRTIAVLWRVAGRRSQKLILPLDAASLEIRDLMGNRLAPQLHGSGIELSLTAEPVYLIVPAAQGQRLLEALKGGRP